ncbi:hypothetical protein WJX72_004376 [[Myrmecia] bisecta]|uniref:SET domain-containing protein n=1 Tax=[Myrmecia] bisecta TaxID=41462 RepID=A0AAW1QRD1_9CHLO
MQTHKLQNWQTNGAIRAVATPVSKDLDMLGSCQTLPDDYDTAEPDVSEAPPYVVVSTPYTGESVARGVAARIDIKRGSLVEKAHCLLVPQQQYEQHARHTVFEHYLFHGKDGQMLLALGVGSLFNHSRQPNLDYRIDHSGLIIRRHRSHDA